MHTRYRVPIALVAMAALLAGCGVDDWFGERRAPPLPGTRVAVLSAAESLKVDTAVTDRRVVLPRPYMNDTWPQAGGFSTNANYHLALAAGIGVNWRASVGNGVDSDNAIMPMPLVVGRVVFAMDAESQVSAFDEATGRRLWRTRLTPKVDSDSSFGGGISWDAGVIFAGTGHAQAVALDAGTGRELWRVAVPAPVRASPLVAGGRLFVQTLDNQLLALDPKTGAQLWRYQSTGDAAALVGVSGPASDGEILILPTSTGDVLALQASSGAVLWQDSVVAGRRPGAAPSNSITDIRARPVIDRDIVFVVGSSDRMIAVDRLSGARLWEREIGGVQTPWAAGDWIYMLTGSAELVCLSRLDGQIRWVKSLPRKKKPDDKRPSILWYGPTLASDRLLVLGSHGEAWALSPYDGNLLGALELKEPVSLPPVVANGALYVLRDDATLVAFR